MVGKAAGGNTTDVAVSGQLAKGATENNYLKHTDVDKLSKALRNCEDQACRDSAMLEAYAASSKNDVELLNCNATANCDALIAEYRKGYAAIQSLVDAGVDDKTLGHIFNMEDSASRLIGSAAYKKPCVTAECVITAQYLVGIGTGLSNITPAGAAVGTVDVAYQLINSIANRGLTETTIAIVKGIQGLPENIVEGLNSTDPKVRGETLVNALLITGVATTVGPKIGVKILENVGTGPAAGSRAAQRGGIPVGKSPNGKPAEAGGNFGAEVWSLQPTERGIAIESQLARTEYKDWFNVGQINNGKFPLVDFQNGNTLVSLKSVDTTGTTWLTRMQDHIYDLGKNGATVNGNPAVMVLDLRVQPGGLNAAQSLIQYGARNNVAVIVKEFK